MKIRELYNRLDWSSMDAQAMDWLQERGSAAITLTGADIERFRMEKIIVGLEACGMLPSAPVPAPQCWMVLPETIRQQIITIVEKEFPDAENFQCFPGADCQSSADVS